MPSIGSAFRRAIAPSIATLALGLALTACGAANETEADTGDTGDTGASLSGTLNGAGSSAQEAAFTAWRAAFQGENGDVTVNYDPVGSGGGREQFLAKGVLFAGSDSYLDDEELEASKTACGGAPAFDVPSYISPIAVAYNLPGVDGLQLSAKTIANIFNGTIKKWNDPAIAAENADAKLPDSAISPVHRADDSGTTKNFTDYLEKAAEGAWKDEADGIWPLKGGEAAQGTSGVIDAITNGEGTIGYADHSQTGDLQVVKVKVGEEYVEPTAEGAAKTVEVSARAEGRPEGDIAIDVDRTTAEAGAYPVILVSYVIACPTYDKAEDAELVKSFLSYVVGEDGQAKAAEAAGSAPLPSTVSDEAVAQLEKVAGK